VVRRTYDLIAVQKVLLSLLVHCEVAAQKEPNFLCKINCDSIFIFCLKFNFLHEIKGNGKFILRNGFRIKKRREVGKKVRAFIFLQ